jgi:predicted peptidase
MKLLTGHFNGTIDKKTGYQYYISLPENYEFENRKSWPVILYLHGMGQRGDDLDQVKENGPLRRIEDGVKLPFVIVAPQCPNDSWWDTDNLKSLLDHIKAAYSVNDERVYLTGSSMGGAGTWALANSYPECFAAIAPVCGFFTPGDPGRFKGLPIWCFHGAMDDFVPINDSLRMVAWIREHGGHVRFTVYPDTGHDSWRETYSNPELYEWFLEHKRQH